MTRLGLTDRFNVIVGMAGWRTGSAKVATVKRWISTTTTNYTLCRCTARHHRPTPRVPELHRDFSSLQNVRHQRQFPSRAIGESAEFGLKSSFLDDNLQTTVSIFQVKQDNSGATHGRDDSGNDRRNPRAADDTKTEGTNWRRLANCLGWQASLAIPSRGL